MKRAMRWYDYFTINVYWFALTARAQTLTPLIVPLLVQQFVGEEAKGAYVGQIRLWALMVAILVQSIMGMLSDRSTHPWGRRRPFILVGALGLALVLVLVGFTTNLQGMTGYWVLFGLYILSMLASDTAHAATQGLIPDLVPKEKRGLASGIKAIMELPLPLIFVSLVIGGIVAAGNLWTAIIIVCVVILVCAAITMLVPEQAQEEAPFPLDWQPIVRLLLMVAVFTLLILGMGELVKIVLRLPLEVTSLASRLLVGLAGLAGMLVAVGLGVWLSIRISIGEEAKENPSFTLWVVTRLAFLVPAINLAGFILYFLQERFADLPGEKAAGPAATAVMLVGAFVFLTAIPSGWLADRVGKKPLVALAGLLAAAGTLVVLWTPSLATINAGACLIGAGLGFFYSANWALGTDIVPSEQAGRYLGLSNLAGAGAGAVGAYIGGPIADKMGYVLLFSIYAVLFLLSIVPLVGIKVSKAAA